MDTERIVQYECKVCGRRIDVTRSGDVYEEPIYCCGVQSVENPTVALEVAKAMKAVNKAKKAVKKAVKKAKKAVKKAVKAVKKANWGDGIRECVEAGGTCARTADCPGTAICASHLGRTKGGPNPEMSLRPVAARLAELLGRPVVFAEDCIGEPAKKAIGQAQAQGHQLVVLDNVRFHKEEEKNDPAFAKQLAELADLYVNDAFGSSHRAHASTEGMAKLLPQAAAGFLMEDELKYLGLALASPERPFVAVLGGAKVSDKIEVIESLLPRVDTLLVGGGMAYTFLRAKGLATGKSLVEEDKLELAKSLQQKGAAKLVLPVDHVPSDRSGAPEI